MHSNAYKSFLKFTLYSSALVLTVVSSQNYYCEASFKHVITHAFAHSPL